VLKDEGDMDDRLDNELGLLEEDKLLEDDWELTLLEDEKLLELEEMDEELDASSSLLASK
jgi:hypothetical protein